MGDNSKIKITDDVGHMIRVVELRIIHETNKVVKIEHPKTPEELEKLKTMYQESMKKFDV